jgi:hypothetical protein
MFCERAKRLDPDYGLRAKRLGSAAALVGVRERFLDMHDARDD